MNLSELIQLHIETSAQLIQAIELDDDEMVEQLDKNFSSILEEILEYRNDDKTNAVKKISFLLDHMMPVNQRTEMTENICSQILKEFSEHMQVK